MRTTAIGKQDFAKIIEENCFYVDKTGFIKEWWEGLDDVTLITRPRRFGKTLTISMVEQFFSVGYAGRGELFHGLKIWNETKFRKLQGTYPVISLSFAAIKETNYENTRKKICLLITDLYNNYQFLLENERITENEKQFFRSVSIDMDDVIATMALHQLSAMLSKYYEKNVIILMDEYDTPMQEAYLYGYWEEMVSFIRSLFHASFKTNPYLERALLTGITTVSKESFFSDLNNLKVITVTSDEYTTLFGFREDEVFQALEEYGLQDYKTEVKNWYDGFIFGGQAHIYNPWSVISFLEERKLAPYWANTSSNGLVGKLIQERDADVKIMVEDLLSGKTICTVLDEEIVYSQLDRDARAVWSLLAASGYLKVEQIDLDRRGRTVYTLSLTNLESRIVFDRMVTGWFSIKHANYDAFTDALLSGDKAYMNEYLNEVALQTFSSFDTGRKSSVWKRPENFYHGFVLGLIADLREIYTITSNRESGRGRYDVMLEPKDPKLDDGILLEFKVQESDEKSLEDSVKAALRQIVDKNYSAAMETKGISRERIRIYGVAFRGKEVLLDGGLLDAYMQAPGIS